MMILGYVRGEPEDQELNTQIEALTVAGVERVFTDNITGDDLGRPALDAMLKSLQREDIVVVTTYSRLASSLSDLMEIIEQFEALGVAFRFLEENIDTTKPGGKLAVTVFSSLARFERKRLARRTRERLVNCGQRGTRIGRPAALSPAQKQIVKQMRDVDHWPVPTIASVFNVSPSTIRKVE